MSIHAFHRPSPHPIISEKPAVNFFEGALLGNGGLGVVVTTRPDSILLHFGHNNVWDIRVAENHKDEIGPFAEIFAKVKSIPPDLDALEDDPWYRQYIAMTSENYNAPYPRPFPCRSLLLGFDRRKAELLGHTLDIAYGLLEVRFKLLESNSEVRLQVFTKMDRDRVWLRMIDSAGNPTPAPFERVRLLPDPGAPTDISPFTVLTDLAEDAVAFSQLLPFNPNGASGDPKDRAFRLSLRVNASTRTWQPQTSYGIPRPVNPLEHALLDAPDFIACVELDEGLAADVKQKPPWQPGEFITRDTQPGEEILLTNEGWQQFE